MIFLWQINFAMFVTTLLSRELVPYAGSWLLRVHIHWTHWLPFLFRVVKHLWTVSVLEARFSKKKRKNRTKRAPRRRVSGRKMKGKNPKRQWYKRKFKLGNFVKTPRRSTARKDNDRWFLSRKTTLNSLINKMKIAKIPLSQLLSK